jgi:ATP-dependent Clp protease ATP-binding subunit ClpB
MEIDSKPEELDRLERRLIQLKIQREALKKEKDDGLEAAPGRSASRDRGKLEREYSDLEEIWKAEKAAAAGRARRSRSRSSKPRLELEAAQRRQDLRAHERDPVRPLPELEKQLAAAQEAEHKGFSCCRTRSPPRRSPRW